MSRPRKTVPVEAILRMGNHFLRESEDADRIERYAVASFMDALLFEANAYAGFIYLESAGVNYEASARGEFEAVDESRRLYLTHSALQAAPVF